MNGHIVGISHYFESDHNNCELYQVKYKLKMNQSYYCTVSVISIKVPNSYFFLMIFIRTGSFSR